MKIILHQKDFDSSMTVDLVTSLRIFMDDSDGSGFVIVPDENTLFICRDGGLAIQRVDSATIGLKAQETQSWHEAIYP